MTVIFEEDDLFDFLDIRCRGLSASSTQDIKKAAGILWESTKGQINQERLNLLADTILKKYTSWTSIHKMFLYCRNFLKYLYKLRMDPQILAYLTIFEKPKTRRTVKLMTDRIITMPDIQILLSAIDTSRLPEDKKVNYRAYILFLAYGGQRPQTGIKLRAGQFRSALKYDPPVLTVNAEQDKNRMSHLVPLHPLVIQPILEAIKDLGDDDLIWSYPSIRRWLLQMKIPFIHCDGWWNLKDLRKGFEQISDEIGFNDANKNFIMSHGISSVNWQSYKQFLPGSVYKRYMEYWGLIDIVTKVADKSIISISVEDMIFENTTP